MIEEDLAEKKRKKRKTAIRDIIGMSGYLMMCVGLWLWSPSLSLTVAGALLMGWAIVDAGRKS